MNIVKELRKKTGIQQKELAITIGVSRPTVSEWEKNKKDPSGERLRKLAEYFGVDELVILGKGVVDLTKEQTAQHIPQTKEAKIFAIWADNTTEEKRKEAYRIMNAIFDLNAEKFSEGEKSDDT